MSNSCERHETGANALAVGLYRALVGMDNAHAALAAAGERQQKIDALIAEKQGKLHKLAADRANKGGGRPNAAHSWQKAALEASIAWLQRGLLPEESEQSVRTAQRAADELRASAAQHPQHHAAAGVAPVGRPPSAGGGRGGGFDVGSGDDVDDGGGRDDDEEDANFSQYYAVSPAQSQFNKDVAHEYLDGRRDRKVIRVEPDELLASGCKPALVGLGAVHICAPHLHLGLPLPPCPRHGWASADRTTSTNASCAQGALRPHGVCYGVCMPRRLMNGLSAW